MKLYPEFFNKENFRIFSYNHDEGIAKIIKFKKTLFDTFSRINENDNSENINNENFEKIYQKKFTIIKNLRFLINKNKETINQKNPIANKYKKLFLKIKKLKTSYISNNIEKYQKQFFAIKNYKKIKKNLYSFNNSYSNLSVFYPEKYNKNKKVLKFKISNFLSKDMTRKFLVPILDIDSYILNFRHFDYKERNIYHHSKEKIYSIDLKIFNNYGKYPVIPNYLINADESKNYFVLENVCYIKTSHHISGMFFVEKNINVLDKNACFYFSICELKPHKKLVKTRTDYDSMNKTCFGSIFRNNRNKKDRNAYLKIYFKDIIFIFNRKYCFRDNSFELFLSNNRSYYFKCKNTEKRDQFIGYLIKFLNNKNISNKKLFKKIKSIDWKNKPITLGYYKNIYSNKNYSSIEEIKEIWKNNKISTLEYLMWINIYGNRSFNDIAQYPVFPWILNKYTFDNTEDIYYNFEYIKRNFKLPMGMSAINESGKERRDGYIFSYRTMVNELNEQKIININFEKEDSLILNNSNTNSIDISKDSSQLNNTISDSDNSLIIESNNIKKKDENLPKIPRYSFNIEKLYMNPNIEMENIPYFYGSHYSNAMYITHYLARLFPFSLIMIEIQSSGFDCPDRLFLSLERTFYSASSEKCDLRELIPEIYTTPEIFLNLNRFNFGKIIVKDYKGTLDELIDINKKYNDYENIENNNENKKLNFSSGNKNSLKVNVEDVILPKWCSQNPFLFILNQRELLEKKKLNINPWIDLIFGEAQMGKKAQFSGNCFLPYTYDGVINLRVKENEILKNRKICEPQMRFFELGVNPTKVFSKQCLENKKTIKQIPALKSNINIKLFSTFDMNKIKIKLRFLHNIGNTYNEFFIIGKDFSSYKLILKHNPKENNYVYDLLYPYKELPIRKIIKSNTAIYKLIIKSIFDGGIILLTGFYDGSLYLLNTNDKNTDKDINYYNIYSKINKKDIKLLQIFGHGLITSLEISKDEKYMVYGTEKGTLAIFSLNYFSYSEDKNNNYIKLLKIIQSHSKYKINSVSVNSDLNIFADCSYDGYVNLYTLPKCELINSIYVDTKKFLIDYVFLTAQPLASIVLYSNQDFMFKSYNINGHDLNIKVSDVDLSKNIDKKCCGDEYMSSIILFTDYQFVDFMVYLFGNRYIILRKMPLMQRVFKLDLGENTYITMLNISLCNKFIYALEKNSNKLYFIEYKKMNNQN